MRHQARYSSLLLEVNDENGNRADELHVEGPYFPEQAGFNIRTTLLDLFEDVVATPDPGDEDAEGKSQ